MRLDQWLWAVRVFKTRALSSAAIKAGRVRVNDAVSKPAHPVKPGEIISARVEGRDLPWTRTLRVLGSPPSRVGAPLVPQFAEDLTPPEEREKASQRLLATPGARSPGSGRPTKRDRRETESMKYEG